MKLSLMKNFYDTVDGEGRSPVLDVLSSNWFDSADTKVIRASANFVARVEKEGLTNYLRFNHEDERSLQHINNELEYIQRLSERGINVNKPVRSRTGKLVESVDTEIGVINAVLFSEVKGEHIESKDLNLDGFSKWGVALAEVHNASHGLELVDAPVWSDQLDLLSNLNPENMSLMNEVAKIRDRLSGVSRQNYGLTVFDFEMDNIKWDRGELGFMDFDDYCVHWYAADIAYSLRDLYNDHFSRFNPLDDRFQAFVDGYRQVRGISEQELGLIPLFILLHNLYFYARLQRANTGASEMDPEWVQKLSRKLREKNESYLRDIMDNPVI